MQRRSVRGLVVGLAVLVVALGLSGPASAAPPFQWDQNGGFTFGSESSTDTPSAQHGIEFFGPQTSPPAPANTYHTIGWGNLAGPSFVTATDPFSEVGPGVANTRSALGLDVFNGSINPGDTVIISHLTHANRIIEPPTLTGISIDTNLFIRDGATVVLSSPGSIPISFTETSNTATEAGCDPATHIASTPPCSDFFIFPFSTFVDVPFSYQGSSYSLTFGLQPGPGTIFEIIDCPGSPAGSNDCGRIRTAELATNTIDITMTLNLLGTPGLSVNKTPDNGTFLPGGQATYTIVVTSTGDPTTTSVGVVLTDQLPSNGGLVWQTASPTQGSCTIGLNGDPANFLRCNLGDIAGGSSVTVTVSSTPTTPLAACQSQPNPIAHAEDVAGHTAEDSGSLSCAPRLQTVTQGGWGAPPHGGNPGQILVSNFSLLGGNVVIGDACGNTFTFTSAAAIQAFLPQGGKPAALTQSLVNPTGSYTVFAGQVLALTLNVKFSNLGLLIPGLGSFVLPSGPAAGKTVNQVLADANKALAGCGLPSYVTSISQLNDVVTSINELFD
jgi:uncharacterized repeat protein (TIGR01451 family)